MIVRYSKDFQGKKWSDVVAWLGDVTNRSVDYQVSLDYAYTYPSPKNLTIPELLRFFHVVGLQDELLMVSDNKGEFLHVQVYDHFRRTEAPRQIGRKIGNTLEIAEYEMILRDH